ncbi:MAG: chemotaxis protein CheW, partial [Exilispira sp.]
EQDIVVQSLDEVFKRIKGISGVAILGDGSVALILDIPEIVRDFVMKNSSLINKLENEKSLAKLHDEIVTSYKPEMKNEEIKIQETKVEEKKFEEKNKTDLKYKTEDEITELSISDLS